ncbi:hypothetical protein [Robiginitalea sp. IMCC43444]|uniref:hypothetical protein n=1 Tax=Robiginitalea sp. IMCC43444 TaxID=3459121 RepID=UPI0040411916
MRRITGLAFLLVLLITGGCSEIPENNDPVIGIWAKTQIEQSDASSQLMREEWIFNDAYLGRYHRYNGNQIIEQTDFRWEAQQGVYTIEYPGLDRAADRATIKENEEIILLEDLEGGILALRE